MDWLFDLEWYSVDFGGEYSAFEAKIIVIL